MHYCTATVQQHEPSNCCIEALSVVVEDLHYGFRECLLDYVIFVAFQNNCKCLDSFWMHVVALCRYNVTRIEGTEVPFTFCPAIELKKLMGHGSTPSDP